VGRFLPRTAGPPQASRRAAAVHSLPRWDPILLGGMRGPGPLSPKVDVRAAARRGIVFCRGDEHPFDGRSRVRSSSGPGSASPVGPRVGRGFAEARGIRWARMAPGSRRPGPSSLEDVEVSPPIAAQRGNIGVVPVPSGRRPAAGVGQARFRMLGRLLVPPSCCRIRPQGRLSRALCRRMPSGPGFSIRLIFEAVALELFEPASPSGSTRGLSRVPRQRPAYQAAAWTESAEP